MKKRKIRKVLYLLLIGVLCFLPDRPFLFSQSAPSESEKKPEVLSLLGKELFAAPAQGEALARLQKDLEEARKILEANPQDPENVILYARRLASLWRYNEAIDVYTGGIKNFPDNAKLYRHRGHRFISIRQFDRAVEDLEKAAGLESGDFDIWYHLGLAYFLEGNFEKALPAYEKCLGTAGDDDSRIAVSNWLYITLRRLGMEDRAIAILNTIVEGMNVEENLSYFNLLLFYKGQKAEDEIFDIEEAADLELATIGYGIGCWYLYNNDEAAAKTYFKKIVETKYWPAFGFIASEAELFRMK